MSNPLQNQIATTLGIKALDSMKDGYTPPRKPLVKVDNPNLTKKEQDFEVSRKAMLNALDMADENLKKVFDTADSYQKPSGWEAAATFIKAVADVAKELKSLHGETNEPVNQNNPQPINVQNAVFVGTTADLIKEIKKQTIIDVEREDTP